MAAAVAGRSRPAAPRPLAELLDAPPRGACSRQGPLAVSVPRAHCAPARQPQYLWHAQTRSILDLFGLRPSRRERAPAGALPPANACPTEGGWEPTPGWKRGTAQGDG